MQALADFLGVGENDELVARAVANSSFDSMKEQAKLTGGDAKGQFMGDPASWSAPGRARLTHEQQWLKPETIALLRRADIFLADTTVGHRDWEGLKRSIPSKWCRNRVDHNTHAMVIRKREARKAVQNRPKRL